MYLSDIRSVSDIRWISDLYPYPISVEYPIYIRIRNYTYLNLYSKFFNIYRYGKNIIRPYPIRLQPYPPRTSDLYWPYLPCAPLNLPPLARTGLTAVVLSQGEVYPLSLPVLPCLLFIWLAVLVWPPLSIHGCLIYVMALIVWFMSLRACFSDFYELMYSWTWCWFELVLMLFKLADLYLIWIYRSHNGSHNLNW
jgi:hypothetical protein